MAEGKRPDCGYYQTERVVIPSGETAAHRQPARATFEHLRWCDHRYSPLTEKIARRTIGENLPCGGVRAACTILAEKRGMLPAR